MKKIRKGFVLLLCFVMMSAGSVYAAENEALPAAEEEYDTAALPENDGLAAKKSAEQKSPGDETADEVISDEETEDAGSDGLPQDPEDPDVLPEDPQDPDSLPEDPENPDGLPEDPENPDGLPEDPENPDSLPEEPADPNDPQEDPEGTEEDKQGLPGGEEDRIDPSEKKSDAEEDEMVSDGTEEEKKVDAAEASAPTVTVSESGLRYKFTVKHIPDINNVGFVQIAVWSAENGQDDIVWYETTLDREKKTATVQSALSGHSGTGTYYIHAYAFNAAGAATFLDDESFQRKVLNNASACSFTVTRNRDKGTFKMEAKNVKCATGIRSVKVRVWCKSEKTDKVWYTLKDTGSGRYALTGNIKNHDYHRGTYYAQVYAVDSKGKKVFLTESTFRMTTSCYQLKFSTKDKVTYTVTSNKVLVPGGNQKVQIAVWSAENGQDDLVWYKASGKNGGKYTATVSIKNHRSWGTYYAAVYATSVTGEDLCLRTDAFSVRPNVKCSLSASGTADADGKFNAVVTIKKTDIPIKTMKYEVWCSDDKSDVYWYHVSPGSDGNFKAVVNTANHCGHRGVYKIRYVAVFENNMSCELGSGTQEFDPSSFITVAKSSGTCERKITYVNKKVSSVKFKVWSVRGGSGDCKTYKGKKKAGGKFTATVDMDDFVFDGKYNIEVYSGSKKLDSASFIMLDYLEEGIKMAKNDKIGYSQIHRCLNPDVDCSSFVHYSLLNTGYNVGNGWPMTTYDEESRLRGAGFSMVEYTGIEDLQPGDILWRETHTEIYVGHGQTVGAHGDENDDIYGFLTGDQTGVEVSIATLSDNWLRVFRLITYQT